MTANAGDWKAGDKYVSITEVDPELAPGERKMTQSGQDGRSIDIRYLAKAADGTVLHDVTFHSIYSTQNEIITVGPTHLLRLLLPIRLRPNNGIAGRCPRMIESGTIPGRQEAWRTKTK